jgi:hypothetical protein
MSDNVLKESFLTVEKRQKLRGCDSLCCDFCFAWWRKKQDRESVSLHAVKLKNK